MNQSLTAISTLAVPNPSLRLRTSARRASRAFTLVEILIAMGIFSLVLAAIYSTWTAILRSTRVGLGAAAAVQRGRILGRVIEETLGSVQSFGQNYAYYAFLCDNGSDATLSFVSRLAPSFPRSGKFGELTVRRVAFSVEQSPEGGRRLVLRQTPLLMDMDKDEKNYPLVLADHVREFKTEFWDTRLQDWIDEWKQTNQIPVLVKVTVELSDSAYSSQVGTKVVRIVSLPSVTVQPGWQTPRPQPGANPINPGANPGVNPTPGANPSNLSPGFLPGQGNPPLPPGGPQR